MKVVWLLAALAACAVGLTVLMVRESPASVGPMTFAPALSLVVMLAAWPFLHGWRPLGRPSTAACGSCGAEWLRAEQPTPWCPACGAVPRAAGNA